MNNKKNDRAYFFNKLYGVETLEEVTRQFKSEYSIIKNNKKALDKIEELYKKYHFSAFYLYSATTIKSNFTAYRNVIKEEGGIWKDTMLNFFYVPNLYGAIADKTGEKIEKKTQTSSELNFKETIKKITSLLGLKEKDFRNKIDAKSNQSTEQLRAYYIVILMGLTGGRRLSEKLAKSKIIEKDGEFYHDGILKKKGDKNLVKVNLLDLPIEDYIKYQKELKKYTLKRIKEKTGKTLKTVTEKDLNLIFDKVFNNAVKRISPTLTGVLIPNVHELRHLYTIEHQERFIEANPYLMDMGTEKREKALKSFRYEILGHQEKKDTSKTYATTKSK